MEVSQTARTIARALRLNEDLTEAIALGHDLGHAPFGHAGEAVLNEICPEGFKHYIQSVRVVEVLEKNGQGLNLTKEVRDGTVSYTHLYCTAGLCLWLLRIWCQSSYLSVPWMAACSLCGTDTCNSAAACSCGRCV